MMSLVGYILLVAIALVLALVIRVIIFLLREEQVVELDLREIEEKSTQ